jgi:hypothetical protein
LRVLASSSDAGEIMAVVHREHPVVGVQFHPESAATEYGYAILDRFLRGDQSRADALARYADLAREAPASSWNSPIDHSGDGFEPPPVELVR